jgi:hypothetical protein
VIEKNIEIRYRLVFDDGTEHIFDVLLDGQTLEQIRPAPEDPPAWARAEHGSMPFCEGAHQGDFCPAALALHDLVKRCRALLSYTEVTAYVETAERTCVKRTSMQKVLSSLVGLLLATSGCPALAVLKPLARFHLPFATRRETLFRAASCYILGEYFRREQGLAGPPTLEGLGEAYKRVHLVNLSLSRRLRELPGGDANLNALVLLDVFAQDIALSIESDLRDLRNLFEGYVDAGNRHDPYAAS